jgi:hypothetical protein
MYLEVIGTIFRLTWNSRSGRRKKIKGKEDKVCKKRNVRIGR